MDCSQKQKKHILFLKNNVIILLIIIGILLLLIIFIGIKTKGFSNKIINNSNSEYKNGYCVYSTPENTSKEYFILSCKSNPTEEYFCYLTVNLNEKTYNLIENYCNNLNK